MEPEMSGPEEVFAWPDLGSKVCEYFICVASGVQELIDEVNTLCDEGWEPLGAPFVADGMKYQGLVRWHTI